MKKKPLHTSGVVNLSSGEKIKDYEFNVPQGGVFIIEFVGVNAFAQHGQDLFFALQVFTNSSKGIYPLSPAGSSPYLDPEFPSRVFGSQQVKLYADPGSKLIATFARSSDSGDARALFDISGRTMAP